MQSIILAAAAPLLLITPDALASPASPVEPGTYKIVSAADGLPTELCLHSDGDFNSKAVLDSCDTTWTITPSGDGFTITHPANDFCLGIALERIFPPMAATLPCRLTGDAGSWVFTDVGDGKVTISLSESAYLTAVGPRRPAVLIGPDPSLAAGQRWTLRRV